MRLYLVQHGEALPEEVDENRPLSEGGKMDVQGMAEFLEESGVAIGRLLHSGKLRAQQTAEHIARAIFPDGKIETSQKMAANDSVTRFAQQIGDWNTDVMLVGHLPFMARLVAKLITANEDNQIVTFLPGSIVCLERDGSGLWSMAWMLRPELLSTEYDSQF